MKEKEEQLKKLLKDCGMQVFVDYLFPALEKDINVTVLEMTRIYPEYSKFTANSQNGRLSKARTIFKNGWETDALEIIANSRDVYNRIKAIKLLEVYD